MTGDGAAPPASQPAPTGETASRAAREVMRHGIVVCDGEATVRQVARTMRDHGARAVLAIDLSGEAVGLVSERDLLKGWDRPDEVTAAEIMDPEPLVVDPAEPAADAARRMLAAGATRAMIAPPPPSEESGRWSEWKERGLPQGMLEVADLLARADELETARQRAAAAPTSGRRVSPWLALGSVAAVLLFVALLVVFAVNSHPAVPHPGCAVPTQGGC
jgi:hypothetical protein